ncbi:MAG: homocysteine S-methyltransferase family protein [Chromatiales bacterium]|nr:homocysteine S-methyltransferase family protein [Chromatiales bacterium]
MNTELAREGYTFTTTEWLRVNVDAPEVVAGIHARYAAAGAELHIANSFSAARHVLEAAGLGDWFESINRASVELCREAIDAAAPHRQWIAGSISTYAAGHDRRNLPGLHELERNCADQACVLAAAGADLIALEMMVDADTCVAMTRGAAEAGLPVSLGLVCFRDESGRVMLFGRGRDNLYAGENAPLDEVLPSIVERMPAGLRLIVAVMHSSPEDTGPAIAVVRSCWDGEIAAYPNTGDYDSGGWDWTDAQTPEAFADSCEQWAAQGARIVGGCCGYGPEHIRAMSIRLAGLQSDAPS